eukprot:2582904-Pleurochrysis_carterae.AAC.1
MPKNACDNAKHVPDGLSMSGTCPRASCNQSQAVRTGRRLGYVTSGSNLCELHMMTNLFPDMRKHSILILIIVVCARYQLKLDFKSSRVLTASSFRGDDCRLLVMRSTWKNIPNYLSLQRNLTYSLTSQLQHCQPIN